MNRTAFVDSKYGLDPPNAVLEDPSKPFLTIDSAVAAISGSASPQPSPTTGWRIVVRPGNYRATFGLFTVPPYVDLDGAGVDVTTLTGSLQLLGETTVRNLTLVAVVLPVLVVSMTAQQAGEVNGTAVLDTVNLNTTIRSTDPDRVLMQFDQPSGMNGAAVLRNVQLLADLRASTGGTNTVLRNLFLSVTVQDSDLTLNSSFDTTIVGFEARSPTSVRGGTLTLMVGAESPTTTTTFYLASAGGGLDVVDHFAAIIVETLSDTPKEDARRVRDTKRAATQQFPLVYYTNAIGAGSVKVAHSEVDLETVYEPNRVLANSGGPNSLVSLTNVLTRGFDVPVPPITGATQNITYIANSSGGNTVSNGGFYTSIVTVNQGTVGAGTDHYNVQDSDETILVSDPVVAVALEDPQQTNQIVLYKGKPVTVKNVSAIGAIVTVTGRIFDGAPQLLPPRAARTFKNDGNLWYVVAAYDPPAA